VKAERGWGARPALWPLAGALALLLSGPAQATLFDPHYVRSDTLPNGLRVIVEEDKGASVVAVEVVVKVGVADEPADQGGIAHLLEHMLWAAGGEADPRAEIEDLGGVTNAGTLRDLTHFYATVPAGNLDLAVRSLARVVLRGEFEEGVMARERQMISDESAMRGDDPRTRLNDLAFATLYRGHPYARRLEGTGASLAAIDAVKLGAFYRAWYVPNNIAVVIAGEVQFDAAVAVVSAAFGHLTPAPIPARGWAEPARPAASGGAVIGTDSPKGYVMAAFIGPAMSEPTAVCATDVLTVLLSNSTFGRLRGRVLEAGLAEAAGVDFLTQRDRALVGAWAICEPERLEEVKQAIQRELARLAEAPVLPKELMVAKRLAAAGYSFANETPSDRANTLAFYEALGNYREASEYTQRLRGLVPEQVQKVAQWYAGEPAWIVLAPKGRGK